MTVRPSPDRMTPDGPVRPLTIESVLLFPDAPSPLAEADIVALADALYGGRGQRFVPAPASGRVPGHTLLTDGKHQIEVVRGAGPLATTGFVDALGSPYTKLSTPDAEERVRRHRAHVFVRASLGAALPNDPRIDGAFNWAGIGADLASWELRVRICGAMTAALAERTRPDLVHWCQSNQLVGGPDFVRMARADYPIPLLVHPRLFAQGTTPGGEPRFGAVSFGAEAIVGREIVFDASSRGLKFVLQKLYDFVALARAEGDAGLPDGFRGHDGVGVTITRVAAGELGPKAVYRLSEDAASPAHAPSPNAAPAPGQRVFGKRGL